MGMRSPKYRRIQSSDKHTPCTSLITQSSSRFIFLIIKFWRLRFKIKRLLQLHNTTIDRLSRTKVSTNFESGGLTGRRCSFPSCPFFFFARRLSSFELFFFSYSDSIIDHDEFPAGMILEQAESMALTTIDGSPVVMALVARAIQTTGIS